MPPYPDDTERLKLVVVAIIVLALSASLAIIPTTAIADDEWSEDCETAQAIEPGTYSGSLSPEDRDFFQLNISEGDYVTGNLTFESSGEDPQMDILLRPEDGVSLTAADGSSIDNSEQIQHSAFSGYYMSMGNSQFRLYAESSEPICVGFGTQGRTVGEWMFSFTPTDETPPPVNGASEQANESANTSESISTNDRETWLEIYSTADNDEFTYQFLVDGTAEKAQVGESGIAADADDNVTEFDNGTVLVTGSTGDAAGDAFIIRGDIVSSQVTGSDEVMVRQVEYITDRFTNGSS